MLGEGLPYDEGELDLDPVVARIGELFPYVVAEINEPDHSRSPSMKAGYGRVARALPTPAGPWRRPPRRDPGRALRLADRHPPPRPRPRGARARGGAAGRRVLVTGGAGSIGRSLTTLLEAFRPELITVVDAHEAALTADRRARGAANLARFEHVLCDVRDRGRLETEFARAAPDVVVHLAAYKHVDWAERYPEEFAATNLDGSWNVLRCAEAAGAGSVVVASTDKAARHASQYGRTKRLMEGLAGVGGASARARAARRSGSSTSSAARGSASELFLRQARAGVPLTVTDTGMLRYWITMSHAAALVGQAILPGPGLLTAADPAMLTVGELAARIWRGAGRRRGARLPRHGRAAGRDDGRGAHRRGRASRATRCGPASRRSRRRRRGGRRLARTRRRRRARRRGRAAAGGEERRAVWLRALGPSAGGLGAGAVRILLVSSMWPGPDDPDFGVFVAQVAGRPARRVGHEILPAVVDHRGGSKVKQAQLCAIDALRHALRARPDVVYAHYLLPAGAVIAAAADRRARARSCSPRTAATSATSPSNPAIRMATGLAVRRATAVIAVSGWLRDELHRELPEARAKTRGHRLRRRPGCASRRATRRRPARSSVSTTCPGRSSSSSGGLDERKNVVRLRDAVLGIPDATLLAVGDGPLRSELSASDKIRAVGRVPHDEVPAYMAAADVVALPSLVEPFGQVILEAMAMERPVLATSVGGPAELVTDAAGALADPYDVAAIRDGLLRAIALGVPNPAGREAAAASTTSTVQVGRIEAVLQRVVSSAAPARRPPSARRRCRWRPRPAGSGPRCGRSARCGAAASARSAGWCRAGRRPAAA